MKNGDEDLRKGDEDLNSKETLQAIQYTIANAIISGSKHSSLVFLPREIAKSFVLVISWCTVTFIVLAPSFGIHTRWVDYLWGSILVISSVMICSMDSGKHG